MCPGAKLWVGYHAGLCRISQWFTTNYEHSWTASLALIRETLYMEVHYVWMLSRAGRLYFQLEHCELISILTPVEDFLAVSSSIRQARGTMVLPEVSLTSNGNAATTTTCVKQVVTDRIDSVIGSAPSNLGTLNELASAPNDDANYAATVTTARGGRYRKAEADTLLAGKLTKTDNCPLAQVTGLQTALNNQLNDTIAVAMSQVTNLEARVVNLVNDLAGTLK